MTLNERINLPDCLESIKEFVDDIVIVDSFSTDNTLEIASRYTDKIYQNRFVNYSKQFIWSLNNADIRHEWILRLDADERWTVDGFEKVKNLIENDLADGIYVRMKIYFMNRWIKHGGFYPNIFLRVYKKSKGSLEDRWMDEHIKVDGKTIVTDIDVIEANYDRQKNITLWTTKHNNYSTREAIEFLLNKHKLTKIDTVAKLTGNKTEQKRWLKENLYYRIPLFVRPFVYFLYRYFIKLGFMDGKEGFIFHTLHAFWYRFLVDVKVYQIEKIALNENTDIKSVIRNEYGIEL
jgi:glycosyltransferase involved in cell wall biosynthesis